MSPRCPNRSSVFPRVGQSDPERPEQPSGFLQFRSAKGLADLVYGGSKPPRQNGLQRMIRHSPFRVPRTAPYFSIAWIM